MFGYGISDFFAKKTIDELGSIKTLFYVQLLGAFMMAPYLVFNYSPPRPNSTSAPFILLFGIFNFLGYIMLYGSFKVGKISIVSPIASSYSILASIVSFLLFREHFSFLKGAALSLVLAGMFTTAVDFRKLKDGFQSSDFSKGIPQAMLSLLIFGLYVPFWDAFLERGGWMFWLIIVRLIMASIVFAYYLFIKKKSLLLKNKSLFSWLFLATFFEVLATMGNTWALNASTGTTSIIVALTSAFSLVTAGMAFIFLRERLAFNQYLGIILIGGGLVLMPFI